MKVFIVHEDPWNAGNPYIYTLIEEYNLLYPEDIISWGKEEFWSENIFSYDIVHFQWPNAFLSQCNQSVEEFLYHIKRIRSKGVKIVSTCHDLEPHYSQYAQKGDAIKIVYDNSDCIIHLGEYSKRLFETKYPNCIHTLLPHHVYDTIHKSCPSKEESISYLGLSKKKSYILCFGTFRSEEERNLIHELMSKVNKKHIGILAPGYIDLNHSENIWIRFKNKLTKWLYQYWYGIYISGKTWMSVPENDVPYYYGASDIVFVQRLKILNSGNIFMPMLFGKVVIGPDIGNVGPILKEWGYPTFDVSNIQTIEPAFKKGFSMSKLDISEIRLKQLEKYSTKVITEKLHLLYCNILLKN